MSTSRSSRTVQGYLGAVVAAALAFAAQRNIAFLLLDSLHPLRPDRLLTALLAMLVVAVAVLFGALWPWLLATWLAERIGIRNPWYYALWGAVAGMLVGLPVFAGPWRRFESDPHTSRATACCH